MTGSSFITVDLANANHCLSRCFFKDSLLSVGVLVTTLAYAGDPLPRRHRSKRRM